MFHFFLKIFDSLQDLYPFLGEFIADEYFQHSGSSFILHSLLFVKYPLCGADTGPQRKGILHFLQYLF